MQNSRFSPPNRIAALQKNNLSLSPKNNTQKSPLTNHYTLTQNHLLPTLKNYPQNCSQNCREYYPSNCPQNLANKMKSFTSLKSLVNPNIISSKLITVSHQLFSNILGSNHRLKTRSRAKAVLLVVKYGLTLHLHHLVCTEILQAPFSSSPSNNTSTMTSIQTKYNT